MRDGLLAHGIGVGGVGPVLQRDGVVDEGLSRVTAHEGDASRDAVVGVGGVLDLDDRVLDVSKLLCAQRDDVLAFDSVAHHVVVTEQVRLHGRVKRGRSVAAHHDHEHVGLGFLDGHVDLGARAEATLLDDAARVLEHDDGLLRGLEAKRGRGLALENLAGGRDVRVRLLEEAHVNHHLGDAARRLADALERALLAELRDEGLVGLHAGVVHVGAAVLVDAGVDHLLVALRLGERPNAVGLLVDDAPVGAEHAVPSGVTQDVEVALVVAGPHELAVLLILVVGNAVAGHHRVHLPGRRVEV